MRSLMIAVLLCAGCGGGQKTAEPARTEFDPEMFEVCSSEDGFAPRYCEQLDDGTWKTVQPPSNFLLQGRQMIEGRQYEAAVMTLTQALTAEDDCGKQYVRELRGEAYYRLGKYKEAFIDFGSIVRDGPENPFYQIVGAWLKELDPHIESGAMIACWAMYDPAVVDPTVKGKDRHWKPYTDSDPPPKE